jgi:hypothetical protein
MEYLVDGLLLQPSEVQNTEYTGTAAANTGYFAVGRSYTIVNFIN